MITILTRTCLKCGWVHFGVTREQAQGEVDNYNAYVDTLSTEEQKWRSSITIYERCVRCGNDYRNFRPASLRDCPAGVTLNPIIMEESRD